MSCNRQTVAAAICGFVEHVTGEKVTQSDWHGLVATAKAEGYQTGRNRLDVLNTITSLRALGASEGDEAAAETALADIGFTDEGRAGMSIDATDGKFPTYTQNMAAVVRYLTNNGVRESLNKVREGKSPGKGSPISDAEIQQRISVRSSALGPEYEPYEFSVTGPDIVASDMVWARSKKEAQQTVNEWAVRFRGQTEFTSEVKKSELDDEGNVRPRVDLGGKEFTISHEEFKSYPDGKLTVLTGKRGGRYFLRPFTGEHTGKFEVVSYESGQPLRDKYGKAIRVVAIGDSIERTDS